MVYLHPKKTKAIKGETSNSQIKTLFWGKKLLRQDQQNNSRDPHPQIAEMPMVPGDLPVWTRPELHRSSPVDPQSNHPNEPNGTEPIQPDIK